jgi:nitrite reductase/ring-hydroxylating ferredoxin subunit
MGKQTWMQWVLAAILVVVAGALIAAAEEERIEVRVEKNGSDEVTVDVNGVTEVVRLDDLADGESRTFDVGDHELVVTRVGDELTVITEGHEFGSFGHHGKSMDHMIWVSEDGDEIEIEGDCDHKAVRKMVVLKSGDGGEGETRTYTIHVDGDEVLLDGEHNIEIDEIIKHGDHGEHGAIFISKDGDVHHQSMLKAHGMHGDVVAYRCEETGSILVVKKDDAIEDAYICPATGCVMEKVEDAGAKVITIKKRIELDEDDD